MRPITNRTELRWALEDMGDAVRPLKDYIDSVLEYADYLRNQADDAVEDLRKAYRLLDTLGYKLNNTELSLLADKLGDAYSDLRYSVKEYDKC